MKHLREENSQIQDPTGKVGEDEPVFLLRATDIAAPFALRSWAQRTDQIGGDKSMVLAALAWADTMETYHNKHAAMIEGGKRKVLPWSIRLEIDIKGWGEGDLEKWSMSFGESFQVLHRVGTVARGVLKVDVLAVSKAEAITAAWGTFDLNIPTGADVIKQSADLY